MRNNRERKINEASVNLTDVKEYIMQSFKEVIHKASLFMSLKREGGVRSLQNWPIGVFVSHLLPTTS